MSLRPIGLQYFNNELEGTEKNSNIISTKEKGWQTFDKNNIIWDTDRKMNLENTIEKTTKSSSTKLYQEKREISLELLKPVSDSNLRARKFESHYLAAAPRAI